MSKDKASSVFVPPSKTEPVKAETPKAETPASGADEPVEKGKPQTLVMPGNFDLSALADIYGALRDGDYYSAFTRSLKFLNEIFNPRSSLRPLAVSRGSVERYAEVERIEGLLADALAKAESGANPGPVAMKARNGGTKGSELGVMEILAIVRVVLELVKQWRNR